MIRTFKFVALTANGTPQPVFGTTTTAAVGPTTAPPANPPGAVENTTQNTQVSIPVTDSSLFLKGDVVNVDVGANEERTSVYSVPDGTHIIVAGLTIAHASGIYVRLSMPIGGVYIQSKDGNTNAIFIGTRYNMVKATGVYCVAKLQPVAGGVQPIEFNSAIQGFSGPFSAGEWWFDGTTNGDSILPSFSAD
jgi:hypothetical protein